jgi:small-conductance mechanosensitive channel
MLSTCRGKFSLHYPTIRRLGLTILTLVLAVLANAQAISTNDSTAKESEPVLIPIENISEETKSLLQLINNINNVIDAHSVEEAYDSIIAQKFIVIVDLRKRVKPNEIDDSEYYKAERIKTYIAPISMVYDAYMRSLSSRIETLTEGLKSIENEEKRWSLTYQTAVNENWLPAIRNRIRDNIREIAGISGKTKKLYNQLLNKQDELTSDIVYLNDLSRRIQLVEDHYTSLIFTVNDPPIWEIFQSQNSSISMRERLNQALVRQKDIMNLFFSSYKTNLYYHSLFFILLLILLYFIKNEVSKWSDEKKDTNITRSLNVIQNPVSTSILISVMLSRAFYPQAPPDALEYFYFLLIVPIMRLIPGIYLSVPRKHFSNIAVLFFIMQFAVLFREMKVLDRFATLALAIFPIIFLVTLQTSKAGFEKETSTVNWKWVGFMIKSSIGLLSISIISNILGSTILTEIIINGVFAIIFGGLIIFSTRRALKSLFSLILQQKKIAAMNIIVHHEAVVKENFLKILNLTAFTIWGFRILDNFMILRPLLNWISSILSHTRQIGSLELTIGSLLGFFFTLWLTVLITRFIRFALNEEILPRFSMARGVPGAISLLVRITLLTLGFTIALGVAKIDLTNITILIGALGVGIGFGLQNIFNNLISGLILVFERPIQVGDVIQISTLDITGEVKEIGIRASIIRSFDGAEVVVPNGNLISNEMINWTLSDKKRRQEIIVGVAYGSDTTKVLEILNNVVSHQPLILKNPPPFIIFIGFGDSSLNFRVLFWTHVDNGLSAKSAVGIAIDMAFRRAGIEIPFPQRDIHIKTTSKEIHVQDIPDQPIRKKAIKQTGRGD